MKLRLINKPGEVGEMKVALFLFASHSFLANNLHFMVKLIGIFLDLGFNFRLEFHQYKFRSLP
jgi:hypothetical protein